MFGRIGRFAVDRPWLTITAWVIATVAAVALAPQLKSTNDQADFLPSHYESVRATELQQRAFPAAEQPSAVAVFQRADRGRLSPADLAEVTRIAGALQAEGYDKVKSVLTGPEAVSPNGKVALASVFATTEDHYDRELFESVRQLRADARPLLAGTGLSMGVTGPTASGLDNLESSGDTDAMIMMATLVLIVVLLLLIFRSPLVALLPVLLILLVFVVATGLIATAAELGGLQADSSVSAILIVVLFGVGTDYILFLLFRYRELLREGRAPREAMTGAVARVGETIASAAGAVVVAFLALALSTMGMLRAMGPSLAIAVAVTLLASLTLVPAVFSLLGAKAFWPSKAWRKQSGSVLADRLGGLVSRRPRLLAGLSGGLLAVMSVAALGFSAEFDSESSLPRDLESVQASRDLRLGFSAGQTDPSLVLVTTGDGSRLDPAGLEAFRKELSAVEGVGDVSPAVLGTTGDAAQFSVVLDFRPAEEAAIDLVSGELRDTAHRAAPEGTEALVGGTSAVLADIRTAVDRDYSLVFPVAGVAIMVILGLLLRSAVAPWYLIAAVGLGFGATLGAAVLVFQQIKGENGLMFALPVFVYLFVVAIGTDYNILMVARLREEIARGRTRQEAVRIAVARSAPTIGAAAVILAGTFGVLVLAANSMLQQLGFAVSFGILITAFVMALVLVPAVTSLLGERAWWPSGDRPGPADGDGAEPAPEPAPEPATA
ncbi:MMPL family transporter [Streptomyces sp. Tu 3180]|uniref:MMPL family transporter n=1 Tax=Streptomyces sp. Tu 3180 TaxID=2682611 RepID=UPI0013583DFE|nr:MMPL family transporter [Streptomyces sp. Tu 3180]KAF3468167.1 MMPL family transporter [Streptomyces sp. Tu 3180]